LETEAIEREHKESQREMLELTEQIKRQKEDAFRQMEQERRDRERREALRREHEDSLNRPRQVPKQIQPKPVVRPPPRPVVPVSNEGLPFEPENTEDSQLLHEYQHRSAPDTKLPKVLLSKRNGYYWIGQRRFEIDVQDQVYVKEGNSLTPFTEWIEKNRKSGIITIKRFTFSPNYFISKICGDS